MGDLNSSIAIELQNFPWHKKNWENFSQSRAKKLLPHALILNGSEGIGKQYLANRMAKSLLCLAPVNHEACNNCKACKTYESGANPDFKRIGLLEDKQQISVNQIREISEFLNYSRSFDSYRVVLLAPIEKMNLNAANSLLKSLEEPTSNTVILLATSKLSGILPTIKSRCQIINVATPSKDQATSWLNIYSKDLETETRNPDELLAMTFGKPLHALEISDDDIKSREELASELLDIVSDKQSVTVIAKQREKSKHLNLLDWQITWLQNHIKFKVLDDKTKNSQESDILASLTKLFEKISNDQQWKLYQQLLNQKQYIHTSVNPLMFVENMLSLWYQASKGHL